MTPILVMSAAALLVAQRPSEPDLIELARANGGSVTLMEMSCFVPTDVADVVRSAPFVFEGIVVSATTQLTPDRTRLFTQYVFDVSRVLHEPAIGEVSPWGTGVPSPPYVTWRASARPASRTPLNAQLRVWGGHLNIDGLDLTMISNDLPTFDLGRHLVLFALYNPQFQDWQATVNGVFEVRDGRVVALSEDAATREYKTVDALAEAIAKAGAQVVPR